MVLQLLFTLLKHVKIVKLLQLKYLADKAELCHLQ